MTTTFVTKNTSTQLIPPKFSGLFCLVALRGFWDFEKTVLHEIRVSGTVGGPLLMQNPPLTRTYAKTAEVRDCVSDFCVMWGPPVQTKLLNFH